MINTDRSWIWLALVVVAFFNMEVLLQAYAG